jgi:hypothetical protein
MHHIPEVQKISQSHSTSGCFKSKLNTSYTSEVSKLNLHVTMEMKAASNLKHLLLYFDETAVTGSQGVAANDAD